MAITGGAKFFEKSQCLAVDGSTIAASTGNDASPYVLDMNTDTRWRSVGSSDATTENFQIQLPAPVSISRLFIVDHNLKQFQCKYDVAGTWTEFAGVRGMDGSKTNIHETAFTDPTAYYEFTPVTAQSFLISMDKTQVADDEKYVNQVILTTELGTLAGFPFVKSVNIDKNSRVSKTISGKNIVQKSIETASFAMEFKNYPSSSAYNADMNLMMTLYDRQYAFLAWICGGRRGTNYFRYTLRGWRLKDIYQMQITKAIDLGYTNNIYVSGLNAKVQFDEHI